MACGLRQEVERPRHRGCLIIDHWNTTTKRRGSYRDLTRSKRSQSQPNRAKRRDGVGGSMSTPSQPDHGARTKVSRRETFFFFAGDILAASDMQGLRGASAGRHGALMTNVYLAGRNGSLLSVILGDLFYQQASLNL